MSEQKRDYNIRLLVTVIGSITVIITAVINFVEPILAKRLQSPSLKRFQYSQVSITSLESRRKFNLESAIKSPLPQDRPNQTKGTKSNSKFVALGKKTLSNLNRTYNTGPGFDYWPNGGIRIAYYHLATFVTYEMLSILSPHPVFVSGPHGNRYLNLDSSFSFGHYNKEFLLWFQDQIMEILQDPIFVESTTDKFQNYLGKTLMTYWGTYIELHQNPDEFKIVLEDYKKQIEKRTLPEAYYYNLAWSSATERFTFLQNLEAFGYDSNVVAPAVYFWLRRHLDGTDEQFFSILESLLKSYQMLERKRLYHNPNALP